MAVARSEAEAASDVSLAVVRKLALLLQALLRRRHDTAVAHTMQVLAWLPVALRLSYTSLIGNWFQT